MELLDLNDDVLLNICDKLELLDLVNVSRTCRLLKDIANRQASNRYRKINFGDVRAKTGNVDAGCKQMVRIVDTDGDSHKKIECLGLLDLRQMIESFGQLFESIVIGRLDPALEHFFTLMSKHKTLCLKRLILNGSIFAAKHLHGCEKVFINLEAIGIRVPIRDCDIFGKISRNCTKLKLFAATHIQANDLLSIIDQNPNLEQLRVGNFYYNDEDNFHKIISERLPNLEQLIVPNNSYNPIPLLNLTKLRILEISIAAYSDSYRIFFKQLGKLSVLERLKLHILTDNTEIWEALTELQNANTLEIVTTVPRITTAFPWISKFVNLKTFDISVFSPLPIEHLVKIVERSRSLKQMFLRRCSPRYPPHSSESMLIVMNGECFSRIVQARTIVERKHGSLGPLHLYLDSTTFKYVEDVVGKEIVSAHKKVIKIMKNVFAYYRGDIPISDFVNS